MEYNSFGQSFTDEKEICKLLYENPTLDLKNFKIKGDIQYNSSVNAMYADFPLIQHGVDSSEIFSTVKEFDEFNQSQWKMPDEYANLDIAEYLLGLCDTEPKLQRVGHELLLYQRFNLFPLLCYLKYFVDTLRSKNILWGVGRGSSVSSYVLYLLGVHRIDSMFYGLEIEEFLRCGDENE